LSPREARQDGRWIFVVITGFGEEETARREAEINFFRERRRDGRIADEYLKLTLPDAPALPPLGNKTAASSRLSAAFSGS